MVSGNLRERVTFESKTPASDTQGGRAQTWTTAITNVAARVDVEDADNETVQAGQLTTTANYRVTVRYRSSITAKMRVAWRGRTLQITALHVPDARREWLTLRCTSEG